MESHCTPKGVCGFYGHAGSMNIAPLTGLLPSEA
jgi:hypothetical protein